MIDALFTLFGLVVVFYLAPRAVVRGYRSGRDNRLNNEKENAS